MRRCGELQDDKIFTGYNIPDFDIAGQRVRFRSTNDPQSVLRFNDVGTVIGVTGLPGPLGRQIKLWIKWDSGGIYPLIDGMDSFDIFEEAGI